MNQKIQIAKVYHECKTTAMNSINFCFHPECNDDSINSHILQKNGILSSIAEDGHVVEMQINKFKEEVHNFKKIGLNNAFSFNCFCNKHDRELFKSIELVEIDFTNYKNLLLFTLRTIYNEKFRKLVNLKMYEGLILNPHLFDIDYFLGAKKQEELGLNDIEKTEKTIWEDLNNGEQSYIFKVREIEKKEICLSAFYNYDTSQELSNYIFENRKDKEEVTDIFVNLFPYKNKSIFMMAYKSKNKEQVKNYVNEFFNGNEKRLERKITNLMMFQCETWVVSNKFYLKNIAKTQNAFSFAVNFSHRNMNERKFFDLNIFRDDFPNKFKVFQKNAENYLHLNGS